MKRSTNRILASAGALAIASCVGTGMSSAAWAADYFEGKTINIIIGFSAGGGVDVTARTIAKHLGKFIPGHPSVVVNNMAGGSSMKAHNFVFEAAEGDGLTLFYGPWFPVSQILSVPGVRFKYQDYALVSAFSTAGYLMYARTDTVPGGLTKPVDILKATDLRFSGQNPFNFFDLVGTLSLEMLGVHYRYVTGYRGSANIRAAVMKDETNVAVDGTTGYLSVVQRTMVEPGTVKPLWSLPIKGADGKWQRITAVPDIPSVIEVYEQAKSMAPTGAKWKVLELVLSLYGSFSQVTLGPPSLKGEPLALLRKGYSDMLSDPAVRAEFDKRFGYEPTPPSFAEAAAIMKSLKEIDADTLAALKAHVAAGKNVNR